MFKHHQVILTIIPQDQGYIINNGEPDMTLGNSHGILKENARDVLEVIPFSGTETAPVWAPKMTRSVKFQACKSAENKWR